jgi:hypothetical protein
MAKLSTLNRNLRNYDSCLYAVEHRLGRYDVYRKSSLACNPPHFLFSLTDSWKPDGRPCDYGVDVVLNRVKAQDLWRDDSFVERYLAETEKQEEAKERDFRNNIESFLYDFRRQFARATNDINTSSLAKIDPRRKQDLKGVHKASA